VAEEGEGVKSQFSSFENNGASFAASMNNLFSMAYTAENEEDKAEIETLRSGLSCQKQQSGLERYSLLH
jgi:hypothetical protein